MALKNTPESKPAAEASAANTEARANASAQSAGSSAAAGSGDAPPPLWPTLVFLAGLSLLYLGQRVVLSFEGVSAVAGYGGLALMLAATAARFVPAFRARGAHLSVARLLDGLQLLGLLGVALFGLTTDTGAAFLGGEEDTQERLLTVLQVIWVICVAVSVTGLAFAELSLNPMRAAAHLESSRVRAAATSGVVLAVAASYCALLVYAASQQEAQADFSYFKTSEPGEATVKLVQKAASPVKVTAFFPNVNQVRKEVAGYLGQLQARSGNLEVTIADRYMQPKLAEELNVVADGTVVIQLEDGKQTLTIGSKLERARPKLIKLDADFHSKLLKLATTRRTVYWTTGHGELNDPERGTEREEGRSADILEELLERQNFRVRELGLSQGLGKEVPKDADAVLVLGPTTPLAPEELAALQRYADAGGKLLLALDVDSSSTRDVVGAGAPNREVAGETSGRQAPDSTAQPPQDDTAKAEPPESDGVEPAAAGPNAASNWVVELAAIVGAELVPTVLADPVTHIVSRSAPSDRVIMPSNRFSSHASVSTLSRNSSRAAVVVKGASYLTEQPKGKGNPIVALRSLPTAFNDDDRNYQMTQGEEKKSYNLAVALAAPATQSAQANSAPMPEDDGSGDADQQAPDGQESEPTEGEDSEDAAPSEMRAFVIADADVLSDFLMGRVVSNQMLVVDALRWLIGEESLSGETQSEEDVRIEHTKQEDVAWFYGTIFGVPLLVLAGGFANSRRLRRGRRSPKVTKPAKEGAVS